MSRTDDIKRMRQLEQELDYHSQRYYVDNAPEISDFEFAVLSCVSCAWTPIQGRLHNITIKTNKYICLISE